MSGFYICATCAEPHSFCLSHMCYLCDRKKGKALRMAMSDVVEDPKELCEHWKPKERRVNG